MIIRVPNHKRLNPKLWNGDGSLRPETYNVINNIVVSAISSLSTFSKIPVDLEKDIVDVVLCGSSASYFYKKYSDLDIKIVVRPDRYLKKMNIETYKVFSKFVSSHFVKKYSPSVCGISVDVGIVGETLEIEKYSFNQKKWLIKPTRLTSDEIKYIRKRTRIYYLAMRKMIKSILKDKNRYKEAGELYGYMRTRRKQSWDERFYNRTPFSLAFSYLSHDGFFKKLLKAQEIYIKNMMTDINCNPS